MVISFTCFLAKKIDCKLTEFLTDLLVENLCQTGSGNMWLMDL